MIWFLLACGPSAQEIQGTGTCAWNQAYQERDRAQADSLEEIIAGAQDCYVLVDPFDADSKDQVAAAIPEIQAQNNEVGCYISIGTCEDWRDDYPQMSPFCIDTEWDAWEGEFFVSDTAGVLEPMGARIEAAAALGCDWVEFDNMDWAQDEKSREEMGFGVSAEQGAAYAEQVCQLTHDAGMKCMAKSTTYGSSSADSGIYDGGTFESFPTDMDWWTHSELQALLDADKLGLVIHYQEWDCEASADSYRSSYDSSLSFLCEDRRLDAYRRL